jgi:cell wall-associated NlpC family hydrolase
MRTHKTILSTLLACLLAAASFGAHADEDTSSASSVSAALSQAQAAVSNGFSSTARGVSQYTSKAQVAAQAAITQALDMLGIRYRWGGTSAQNGYDCSGFVVDVFRESVGLVLPRTAFEIAQRGLPVARQDLKPGDLVFFNTMKRAFSHVGIYIGDNKFVHAPRTGAQIRVDDLNQSYWTQHYEAARRVTPES